MANELKFSLGEGSLDIDVEEALYPKDAIYGAAYVFIDRCYVFLRRVDDKVRVTLKPKRADADAPAMVGEFQNELLGQAWRAQLLADNRTLVETVVSRALGGAAGPPGLDELLGAEADTTTAFDDPLGIAMSWEEKYGKKKDADETAGDPAADKGAS